MLVPRARPPFFAISHQITHLTDAPVPWANHGGIYGSGQPPASVAALPTPVSTNQAPPASAFGVDLGILDDEPVSIAAPTTADRAGSATDGGVVSSIAAPTTADRPGSATDGGVVSSPGDLQTPDAPASLPGAQQPADVASSDSNSPAAASPATDHANDNNSSDSSSAPSTKKARVFSSNANPVHKWVEGVGCGKKGLSTSSSDHHGI